MALVVIAELNGPGGLFEYAYGMDIARSVSAVVIGIIAVHVSSLR